MVSSLSPTAASELAAQVRERLVAQAAQALASLLVVVQDRLSVLMNEAAPSREMQARRDTWMLFQGIKSVWQNAVLQAWQAALVPKPAPRPASLVLQGAFELVGTEVAENKIIASRLALSLMEHAADEVNDLRKRLKVLNGDHDLSAQDLAHPETLLLPVVEQWTACGLSREAWQSVSELVQRHMTEQLRGAYASCNVLLKAQGVLPVIEFSARPGVSEGAAGARPDAEAIAGAGRGAKAAQAQAARGTKPRLRRAEDAYAGAAMSGGVPSRVAYADLPWGGAPGRVERARGLLDKIGHLLGAVMPAGFAPTVYHSPSSATLLAAIDEQPLLGDAFFSQPAGAPYTGSGAPVLIERVATQLRKQSAALKVQAQTDNEKAIIELVALMFQSILQEDRIPTGIRVWFARLQMPVLRLALSEPDFFQRLNHPARQLIDHMGSCVMGFDASGISSEAMETEIKRVVQVIEQYPETGEKVYVRVYEEFQAFLKTHLAQKPVTQKVVGVAQQVEQKETLTIQFTIELRNQLKDMPVRDEIREFLYKVWAEVLAVSAMRDGAQHEETLLLKKTASDLIWAASAKPNRSDRARVIADLPELLQCLRVGMALLGVVRSAQEAHIKVISDTLADAFMSKTEAIADEQIQALAQRLAHLEDYIGDDDAEELPLDAQSIEDLLGIDASGLDVIIEGGGTASAVMLEWAHDLDLGAWFRLDYHSQVAQVQYVWRSPLGHLHLFASNVGHSYLIQTVRLAAYLQAGLLEPQENEPLTQRATRDAMQKLEAHPESLLA
jgi:type III secretion system FlhB-like substrate exporter